MHARSREQTSCGGVNPLVLPALFVARTGVPFFGGFFAPTPRAATTGARTGMRFEGAPWRDRCAGYVLRKDPGESFCDCLFPSQTTFFSFICAVGICLRCVCKSCHATAGSDSSVRVGQSLGFEIIAQALRSIRAWRIYLWFNRCHLCEHPNENCWDFFSCAFCRLIVVVVEMQYRKQIA